MQTFSGLVQGESFQIWGWEVRKMRVFQWKIGSWRMFSSAQ